MSDILGAALTVSFVLIFLVISEGLAKIDKISKENARKLIHISVGNVVFFIPIFDTRLVAAAIPASFVLGNYLLSPMSPIAKLRLRTFKAGHAWGTILYPLSLSSVVFLFFDQPYLIIAAFFPVVYGDGFAAVFGPKAKSGRFTINGNKKTLLGSSIVSLFSLCTVIIGIVALGYSPLLAILLGSVVALIAPVVEVISPTGMDNLVLPIVLSSVFIIFNEPLLLAAQNISLSLYVLSLGFGFLFALGGYIAKVLTPDGAITGFILNSLMFGLGGLVVGVQLFLFFILGSGATKLVKRFAAKTQDEFEKGGARRDALQALAKAGIPSLLSLILLFDREVLYFYVISGIIAAALVDTMATEIGIATDGTPVHVLRPWKRAKPGQTGVISFKGTIGGLIFGIIFIIITYVISLYDPYTSYNLHFTKFFAAVLVGGFIGMISDSILGTTVQRHNQCQECNKIVEAKIHHDLPTTQIKGISWFNNDLTNIMGSTLGGLFSGLLYLLFL